MVWYEPMQIKVRVLCACNPFGKTMACGSGWSAEVTHALILFWGEVNVQEKLDGMSRKCMIYEAIAEGICEAGDDYTYMETM